MLTSALSLAISIPATTRPFCAIIQLPSLLGSVSKPMQLFGLRKTPDLSLAPRQALAAFEHHGLRSSDGRLVRTARSHILADFADTRARRKPLKPLRGACRATRRDRGDYTRVLPTHCTRGCGRSGRPAFPAPSVFREREIQSKARANCAARSQI